MKKKNSKKTENNILSNLFMWFSIITMTLLPIIFLIENNLIILIIYLIIAFYLSRKIDTKKFPIILFITCLIIKLVTILVLNFSQTTDAKLLLAASQQFARNDYSFQNIPYFTMWGYQTGFVIYQGLILKLFSNPISLKILNVIYSTVLVMFVYYVCKKATNDKTAKFVSMLYMIFPYHAYMNTLLLNHPISAMLICLSIPFLTKEDKKPKDYLIAVLLIGLSNILRPEGIIIVFSFAIYEILKLNKDNYKKKLIYLFSFILVYLLIGSLASFSVKSLGINKTGLKNNDPLWKFVLGFNHDTCGYYTDNDTMYLQNEKKAKKVILERAFSNPIKTTNLFACKTNKLWLHTDLSVKNDVYKDKTFNLGFIKIKFVSLADIVIDFNNYIYLLTLAMAIYGVFIKRKEIFKSKSLFFVIILTVSFYVFLLIEIQARYAYLIQIMIFIMSCYGYSDILERIEKHLPKKLKC